MQYNTFYIPIGDNGEAQEQLNAFLRGHRVLQVERHVFEGGWGFCVEWLDGTGPSGTGAKWKTPRVDYREVLDEEEFARFAKFRERRKAIAAEDGIAPYMVLTDAQMAETAKLEVLTRTAFVAIPGVGEARDKKFFDSIPHEQLKMALRKVFKDRILLGWFDRIVDTYSVEPGRGLPIGNLTSQHFANLYMDKIDRLCGLPYVRYMDDFVFWVDDKDALRAMLASVRMAADSLGLQLKDSPEIREARGGMDFLGMRMFPGRIRANRRSIRRYERRVAEMEMLHRFGRISEEELQGRISAMTAFLQQGDTLGWRRKFWGTRREVSGSNRVMRGGSWNNDADNCRSSNRNNNTPSNDDNNNGFRLFCSAAPQGSELAVPAGFPFLKGQGEYRCDSALVGRGPKITKRNFNLKEEYE